MLPAPLLQRRLLNESVRGSYTNVLPWGSKGAQ